jgi:hypothetical protein
MLTGPGRGVPDEREDGDEGSACLHRRRGTRSAPVEGPSHTWLHSLPSGRIHTLILEQGPS